MDQAAGLRRIKGKGKGSSPMGTINPGLNEITRCMSDDQIRVISITSGKGGVGKTHIAANLAYIFSRMGKRTLVLDADMGLANIDVILGLAPRFNLHHVLSGEKRMEEILVRGPGDMMILPSASGIQEMANLSAGQKLTLLDEINGMNTGFDFVLIDTAAGIAGNVMYFNMAAKEIIVVVSPEPTSLTDAYALIKLLYRGHNEKRIMVLVNMVKNPGEARDVYRKLSKAVEHFLDLSIEYLGYILYDEKVTDAVKQQRVLAEVYPSCQASRCLLTIAEKMNHEQPANYNCGSLKFFSKATVDRGR
ncbi:MAG: MinD/ParA family protein [Syntrophales bacterium]|nr:MinD/ParA family protein [Syntrophales bacterium]MDD5231829.1 MinD/ParA family protein [Syntrophales bacterium]MDD5531367.1 MinD/ParA family protein [Syntrophales bacterium]